MFKVICLVLTILCLSTSLVSSFTFTLQQVKDSILITPSTQLTANARIYDTLNQEVTANCTGSSQLRTCRLGNIPSGLITITDGLDSATTPITLAPFITFVSSPLTTYADASGASPIQITGKFFEPNYSYNVTYTNGFTNHSVTQVPTSNTTFLISTGYIGIGENLNVSITKFNSSVSVVLSNQNFLVTISPPNVIDYRFDAQTVNSSQGVLYLSNLCAQIDCGNNAISILFGNNGGQFQNVSYSRPTVAFPVNENWSFGPVEVKVADQVSDSFYFSPMFADTLLIQDLQPNPSILGGNITITGRFMKETDTLGNKPWNFLLEKRGHNTIQLNHTYLSNQYPFQIEIQIPSGTGNFNILYQYSDTNGDSVSQPFHFNFTAPSISNVSTLNYEEAGKITIEGDQFGETNLLVKIGSTECTNATITVPLKTIVCNFDAKELPTNDAKTLDVIVQVDLLVSAPGVFSYKDGISGASTNTPIHLFFVAILVVLLLTTI
ncbi:hypothetical protein DFA_04098 [Cavenderia fasciculata]|uniref:IPT/TIG domain-containing protein n=1 Tax=Cavenderia fasciculata TaxID=261658 RepID=F4Q1A3_CACFS|nr:uncharacterized protein DFA_04098 [Cavenderia fasciculata]EGG18604.1 hypothetical protein DFA_04098 [Cavenderia fasciculata]|eukprot:XP_004366508.1 hypothetical protein DFA_04098 [Cavenderia fasciculata]